MKVGDLVFVLTFSSNQSVALKVTCTETYLQPDVEEERKRIEARNPTPKKPLVSHILAEPSCLCTARHVIIAFNITYVALNM